MILSLMDKIKEDTAGRTISLSIIYAGNKNLVQQLPDVFEPAFDCSDIYISRINTGSESYAVFFTPH